MAYIKGYKYDNEQLAKNAQQYCNLEAGIPISPNATTINAIDYQFASLNNPTFYYITETKGYTECLGETMNFEVIMPEINL